MAIKPFTQQQRAHTIAPSSKKTPAKSSGSTNFVGVLRVGASQNRRLLFDYIHFCQAASGSQISLRWMYSFFIYEIWFNGISLKSQNLLSMPFQIKEIPVCSLLCLVNDMV
ncbi:hypothetical protein Bca4012_065898 [Brassica carinata]